MKIASCSKPLFAIAIAVLFLASLAIPAAAQTSANGNINGTVTDKSGAAVSNATVVVTDTDTGVARTVITNATGEYNAPFLQPGHYEMVFSGSGFSKLDRKNLVITVGQVLTVDAELTPGAVDTIVNVTSESPILDTEKTAVSQTLDQALISNLPVAARNWSDFVLLTPNVVQDGGSGLVAFHGISALYNQNYVDGSNNNQMLFSEARGRSSGAPYVYSIDSIKEFQTETSNYSVEFGQAAGGQVNAITKSGTNALHGDLFYSLRYPDLNALDPYNKFQALHNGATPFLLTQPIHQQNQFGGSVGGPIIKDKLFYFFTYDGFRRVGRVLYSDSNYISLTPSATTPPPAGTSATSTITPTQCPTTITSTQCNSAISFLIQQSNINGAPPSRFSKENLFFPRIDWHVNAKNDLFVDFNYADFDSTYGYSPANTFSNSSPSTNAPTSYHERFIVGGFTTQIGANSVNQVHAAWGQDLETAGANAPGPSVATGVVTFGMPNALPRVAEPNEHRTQITDVFSTTKGRHTFKFGADANIVHEIMINLFQGGGVYSYGDTNAVTNFQDWAQDAFSGQVGDTDPYAGYHYNTFVQTVDVKNSIASGRAGADDFWMKMWDGFAEDTWKLRPNLTVNLGVRYDVQLTPPPTTNNTNYPPISTLYSSTIKNVTNRVQPRIGISWSPNPGTVVRAGYGLFSALNQGSTYYAMRVENGVVQINYNYTGCISSVGTPTSKCPTVPSSASKLAYPFVPFPVTGPALSASSAPVGGTAPAVNGPSIIGPQSFHGLDPNFVPPYAQEMSASVEQSLPGNMSLSVGYVGTRGMRLPVFLDANLIGQTPHGLRTYNVVDANNNLIKQLTVPFYLPTDRNNTSLSSYNTGFSVANTWYNSMAATLRRPFSNGLELLLNYTWAHASDTGQVQGNFGTFYGGDTPLDPNHVRLENGLSDIDIRNRFAGSAVYQSQIMKDNKFFKYGLNPFLFSGTMIASGGQPISAGMTGTVSGGAEGNIYGGAMSSSSGASTTGRPPQIGRNSQIGPGFNNIDFRLSRNVPIHESIYLQFSADAFNLLNHKIVSGVNSSYSTYSTAAAPTGTTPNPACNLNTQAPGPGSAPLAGCIAPFSGTGLTAFGAVSGTSSGLYNARQLQVSAKLFF